MFRKWLEARIWKGRGKDAFESVYTQCLTSRHFKEYCSHIHGAEFLFFNMLSHKQLNFLTELFKNSNKANVIDIGCGLGGMSKLLLKLGAKEVHAVDICDRTLSKIPKEKGLYFEAMDLDKIHLEESTYDFALCIDSFFHLNSPRKLYRKIKKSLRSGGKFILFHTISTIDGDVEKLYSKFLKELEISDEEIIDFSSDDKEFWQRSKEYLAIKEEDFFNEGVATLWKAKSKEAGKFTSMHESSKVKRFCLVYTRP